MVRFCILDIIAVQCNNKIHKFQAEIFQEFNIREDLVSFQVNLTVLLDCLNIFGGSAVSGEVKAFLDSAKLFRTDLMRHFLTNTKILIHPRYDLPVSFSPPRSVTGASTALRMCYRGYGYPLTLFLEEGGVVTVCKINTQEPEEPIDFDFCTSNVTNKVNCFTLRNDKLT